jgi:hypothetical protein
MEVRSDPFESAKSHLFDTSSWGAFCDVTLTVKQARQSEGGAWSLRQRPLAVADRRLVRVYWARDAGANG